MPRIYRGPSSVQELLSELTNGKSNLPQEGTVADSVASQQCNNYHTNDNDDYLILNKRAILTKAVEPQLTFNQKDPAQSRIVLSQGVLKDIG